MTLTKAQLLKLIESAPDDAVVYFDDFRTGRTYEAGKVAIVTEDHVDHEAHPEIPGNEGWPIGSIIIYPA